MSNTIKVPLNIFETLPSFVDYIEFWKIIWWETMFFNMFKLNDVIIKKNTTCDKHNGGLQAMRQKFYMYTIHILFYFCLKFVFFIFIFMKQLYFFLSLS